MARTKIWRQTLSWSKQPSKEVIHVLEHTWLVLWSQLPPGSPCAARMWPARCAGLPKEGHVGFVTFDEKELSASEVPSLGLDFEAAPCSWRWIFLNYQGCPALSLSRQLWWL